MRMVYDSFKAFWALLNEVGIRYPFVTLSQIFEWTSRRNADFVEIIVWWARIMLDLNSWVYLDIGHIKVEN